ncbi:hypothetical protein [Haemophilus pittmaniae]|nr:hypothetical protein [Haemophilus pittmaniae]
MLHNSQVFKKAPKNNKKLQLKEDVTMLYVPLKRNLQEEMESLCG